MDKNLDLDQAITNLRKVEKLGFRAAHALAWEKFPKRRFPMSDRFKIPDEFMKNPSFIYGRDIVNQLIKPQNMGFATSRDWVQLLVDKCCETKYGNDEFWATICNSTSDYLVRCKFESWYLAPVELIAEAALEVLDGQKSQ